MNITSDYPLTIFRNTFNDRIWFKTSLSKKLADGSYDNASITVQFNKDVDIPDKTKIYISKPKDACLSFYKDKEGKPVYYLRVFKFETVQDKIDQYHVDFDKIDEKKNQVSQKPVESEDPYKDFASEVVLAEEDLPF